MMIVVGSGPCGVACAYQLLKSGKQVVMLDAGMEVVPDYRRELLRFIANEAFETLFTHRKRETCYAEWAVNGLVDSDIGHYDSICRFHSYDIHHGKVLLSLARGGFSNVWGGAVLPIRREDVAGWPIRYEELQKHFSTVDEMMGMSCSEEWPVSQFDIGLRSAIYPDLTNQSQEILDNLERCKDRLSRCGIYFSKARIALGPNHSPFRSTTVLDKLLKNPNFRYIPKIFVLEVKEENHSVNIFGYDLINGKLDLVRCDRLFLACGALASTAIIARSLCMFDHTFYFKDTQHFVLPVMQLQRPRITIAEKENELAQIFVEISDQCIGNRFVHLQVYGYSDQLHQLTQQWFKWVPNQIISSIGDVVFERVIMILGFLPSDISGKLEVRFLPPEKDGQIQIKAQGVECKEAYEAIHRIVRLILANRKAFGGIPLLPVISIAVPGTSNHIGGSMPMELHPKKGSTDVLGRPHGMNRTHIVDSTVLPSIPATTIAYTAMANAVRIADQAVGLDM